MTKRIRIYILLFSFLFAVCLTGVAFSFKQPGRNQTAAAPQASPPPPPAERAADYKVEEIAYSIILAGDTGDIDASFQEALISETKIVPEITSVFFLGDNVYLRGVTPADDPEGASSRERLLRQTAPLRGLGAHVVFVPGNHDWDFHQRGGWQAVLREQEIVERELGVGSYRPRDACPGPELALLNEYFQVIALDTQWWLHEWDKPGPDNSSCRPAGSSGSKMRIGELLRRTPDGVLPLVVSHHPLAGYGPHSSGSSCPQDKQCPAYAQMVETLLAGMERKAPFICAAGHDHSLQVIRGSGRGCSYYLVSGAGSNIRPEMESGADLLFSATKLGFMRIDRLVNGRIELRVLSPEKDAAQGPFVAKSIFAMQLR